MFNHSVLPFPSTTQSTVPQEEGKNVETVVVSSKSNFDVPNAYRPKSFQAWAMGMTTVIGGIYYGWNAGLVIGFGGYLIAQVLMGSAYVVLVFALAEIVSSTSFSGGAYGMARVMLGFYVGFLVAVFEFSEYISYTAASYQYVASYVCLKMSWNTSYQPVIALVCYLISALFLLERGRIYWSFITLLGVYCVVGLLFYVLGSLPFTNFVENASMHVDEENSMAVGNWFAGGMSGFLSVLPLTTWAFGGIESGALVTDLIYEPKKNLTKGLTRAVLTLFVLMMLVMFVCVSLPPGLVTVAGDDDNTLVNNTMFTEFGYAKMGLSAQIADWMMFPAQIAMGFGFMLPAAKLFHAMSLSKLIPSELGGSNLNTVFFYTIPLSYTLCLCAIYFPTFDITNIPIFFAIFTYLSDLYAYYQLQTDFTSLEREFHSPFGIIGAIFAALIFLFCIISLAAFQPDSNFLVEFVGCFTVLISLYYYFYAVKRQIFSSEEQKTLLTMHVIQLNRRKRSQKKNRASSRASRVSSVHSKARSDGGSSVAPSCQNSEFR